MFLSEELLEKIHSRAYQYDLDNSFPYEDYNDLKAAGYYKAFVPKQYGGFGLSLKELANEQTRLAKAAPATALGINMHHIIVGLGKYLVENGNMKGEQILKDAANGELLAFAISEPSNDRVLFGSISEAVKDDHGGYFFNGNKVFISMIQECTRLVTYAQDENNGDPKSVFAYLNKDDETMIIDPTWNTLGMRATQSQNLKLQNAHADETQILDVISPSNMSSPVVFGIFIYFELLLAASYHGIGLRAVELGIDAVKTRKSVANNTTYDQDKNIRYRIAKSAILNDAVSLQIDKIADDFENDVDYGHMWMLRLSAIKNHAVEASVSAVDEMIRAVGGRSYYNEQELSRLLRDVYAGIFQPSDMESLHDSWAGFLLGEIK